MVTISYDTNCNFLPGVFEEGNYTIRAIQAGTGKTIEFSGLKTEKETSEKIQILF